MNRDAMRQLIVEAKRDKEPIILENAYGKVIGVIGDDGDCSVTNVDPQRLMAAMLADPARHAANKDARMSLVKAVNRQRIKKFMASLFN
jgi:hypothetical protein